MKFVRATLLVARREAKERARSKAFLASTAVTVLLLGVVAAVVTLSDSGPPSYDVTLVGATPPSLAESLDAAAVATGVLVDVTTSQDPEAVADALELGDIDAAILDDDTILLGEGAPGGLEAILEIGLRQSRFIAGLEASGLDPATISDLLAPSNGVSIVRAESDEEPAKEGIAFVSVVLLFVVITTYGQWVLMGVLEEKSTRVVELVVSSTSVRSLLAGKVLGIGLLGIAQLALIIALALTSATLFDLFEIPGGTVTTVAWALVWFILGFAFYAVLNAAAGSLVSRSEDGQAAATPIALVAVASYMLTFILVMPNPDGVASRILSLLPPVAPIALPARIAFVGVPLWEILLGVAIMLLAIVGVVRLAARVYAGALLAAGGRVKISEAWRAAGELATGHD